MDDTDSGRSGYYQEIARAFLERRGGGFFLSPKDQAVIAAWEDKTIPLGVVLEGIGRTFDELMARGRGTKAISLAFCGRQVEAAFAQHRDRLAGRRRAAAGPRPGKGDKARHEIEKAIEALAVDDLEMKRLLGSALEALAAPRPAAGALERIDAEVEEVLWARATAAEKAAAEIASLKGAKGRKPAGFADQVRRRVIMSARAGRRIPHASLHYY